MASGRPVDPERLLPGESGSSQVVDDVEHWIRVYSEFVRFKRDLLSEVERASAALPDDLPNAASVTEVSQLRAQYERLLVRLTFWKNRLVDLKAAES